MRYLDRIVGTRHFILSIIHFSPLTTVDCQLSIIHFSPLSTVNCQLSTIHFSPKKMQQFEESLDRYFAIESEELIQTIEQTLLSLLEEKTVERVHTLMRAAHTIKGGAANCGLKTIETIAHHLEDVFQALYPEELAIDDELGALLLEGYEVLYTPLSALLTGYECDEEQVLEQTADLFARLQAKLGDFFGREAPLPTAEDLGFDVVGLIFGDSVPEDIAKLAETLDGGSANEIQAALTTQAQFFLELGASYSLPGIEEIAKTTITALELHPDRIMSIAKVAIANFQSAHAAIMAGDRERGGEVSPELSLWLTASPPQDSGNLTPTLSQMSGQLSSISDDEDDDDDLDTIAGVSITAIEADTIDDTSFDLSVSQMAFDDGDMCGNLLDLLETSTAVSEEEEIGYETSSLLDLLVDSPSVEPEAEFNILSQPPLDLEELDDSDDLMSLISDPTPAPAEQMPISAPNDAVEISADLLALVNQNNEPSSETLDLLSLLDDDNEPEPSEFFSGELIDLRSVTPTEQITSIQVTPPTPTLTSSAIAPINNQTYELATTGSPIDRILQSISIHVPDLPAPKPSPPPSAASNPNAPTIRVAIDRLDRLSHVVGELLIDENQQNSRTEKIQKITAEAIEELSRADYQLGQIRDWSDKNLLHNDRPRKSTETTANKQQPVTIGIDGIQQGFDILEMDVYSDLHLLLQKLTDHMTELSDRLERLENSTQKLQSRQGKRTQMFKSAQSELLQARMEPISTVFDRFPRLVQQMVTKHKKPAELLMAGTSVLVDKTVADKLYDPLLHLIRNSYDHGLESAETRQTLHKRATGQIIVTAAHHGNRTTIEVRDDGGGLNFERIRQKGIDQKLLSPQQAAVATEAELAELLFHPGFSTADKVSELSGRGIGLDVVRTQIEAFEGTISVRSVAGQGSTFTMQIPLNFTTARLLVCESQGKTYALLSDGVTRIVRPTADRLQQQSSADRGTQTIFRHHDGDKEQLISVHQLGDLVNYNCPIDRDRLNSGQISLLMFDRDRQKLCLAVDRIVGEQELAIAPLGNAFILPSYIQGYSILKDGSLTLAIDPVATIDDVSSGIERVRISPNRAFAPAQPDLLSLPAAEIEVSGELMPSQPVATRSGKQTTVLVVDDSMVQRQSLFRTLSGANYIVLQANNGQEALAQLNQHPEIELVVCDIEMPHMNGFEFLSYCRQDARLSQIPTIMLTTRSGAKHRQLALALGAKAYTTKPHGDRELLEAVQNLLGVNAVMV
jgi:two-component system, chemotaxis family, sensor histidine kinase and response regulator PixL